MSRWRLDLEYDGTLFAGWQAQGSLRTIQAAVEAAATRIFNEPVRVSAAGRTDTGVHAEHQVASFLADTVRTRRAVVLGMNAVLPSDVSVVDASQVPDAFDPRRSLHGKRYRYRWLTRLGASPLRRDRAWHGSPPLNSDAMAEAITAVRGQHDFSSFRAAGCQAATAVRTVQGARVLVVGDEIQLVMEGTGFLRNMIRIVAGSLTEIGRGAKPTDWLATLLHTRDRGQAGPTAPPHGLTLERIWYAGEPDAPRWAGFREVSSEE